MSMLHLFIASFTLFSSGAPIVSSQGEASAHAFALERRENRRGDRARHASVFHTFADTIDSLTSKHVRRQRNRYIRHSLSLLQIKRPVFPDYFPSNNYVHPLSVAGQDLENRAVKALTEDLVMGFLQTLIHFPTRSYSNLEESVAVEHFLKKEFSDMGLAACFHTFASVRSAGDGKLTNVVALLQGSTVESVIVGAHYDSRPYEGSAPGANDNGSGVAALLAIAKAITGTGITPRASIYFVAFAGEEAGLIGSEAFSEAFEKGGTELPKECRSHPSTSLLLTRGRASASLALNASVIIMDEIGWKSPALANLTVNMETYDWSGPVMDHMYASSRTHNGESLQVIHSNNPFGSDHMSFLDKRIMAVLTINGDDEAYPSYHQSSDTISNINPSLLLKISKMNLGAVLRIAGNA